MRLAAGLWATCLLLCSVTAWCDNSAAPEVQSAQAAYEAGRYADAWQKLRNAPDLRTNPYRAYQAGLALAKLEQPGAAHAYFTLAHLRAPGDPDLEHNFELTRAILVQALGSDGLDPASNLWERAAEQLPLGPGMLGLGVLCLVLANRIRRSPGSRGVQPERAALGLSALMLLTLCVLRGGWGVQAPAVLSEPQGIRSGPGESFLQLGRLEAGVRVRATGESSQDANAPGWIQIRYSGGSVGWVKESGLLLL